MHGEFVNSPICPRHCRFLKQHSSFVHTISLSPTMSAIKLVYLLVVAYGSASLQAYTALNQTLCSDKCDSGCKTYISPIGCYNPAKLWPHDSQWADFDILDTLMVSGHEVNRTFFKSKSGKCQASDGEPVELPVDLCIGPFGKPRPWGKLSPLKNGSFFPL